MTATTHLWSYHGMLALCESNPLDAGILFLQRASNAGYWCFLAAIDTLKNWFYLKGTRIFIIQICSHCHTVLDTMVSHNHLVLIKTWWIEFVVMENYRQTYNIIRTLLGNKLAGGDYSWQCIVNLPTHRTAPLRDISNKLKHIVNIVWKIKGNLRTRYEFKASLFPVMYN